ncbi:OmpA family protein [Inquilinus sp. Marseille-Q2685]|uniref:OmpA family protein n=1 Tax=Inquilinus sp. Marseille-Q2685 TaxID=2866581 RepID=UPI001CE479A0|nr:OmpA family protein [Inquilinus sp. Marseille-Q2685]
MLRPIALVLTSWVCFAVAAGAADPPVAPAPAGVETIAAVPDRSYLVFFDFDSSHLTPEARQVVASAAADALQGRTTRIDVTGHTDRSGSVQYNQALSVRRGESVRRELVADGVADSLIAVRGVGESDPLVPPADGVREPQNRRVEIVLSPTRPATGQSLGRGIWGAIAYSAPDQKRGFFWGADKADEAQEIALRHCVHRGGQDCRVVSLFRNYRHWWDDDDKSGFPYEHCAALSVGKPHAASRPAAWGAASATTRREAEEKATAICGGDANDCEIHEWVCT